MITLYHGSGSTSYRAEGPALDDQDWERRRSVAIALLSRRGKSLAAELLQTCGFSVRVGDNDFHDEFHLLYRSVGLGEYVDFESFSRSPEHRQAFADIAKTITELGLFIRFVAVELVADFNPQPVSSPNPPATSATVERALIEAEQLVRQDRPVSAVDRAHTALHGYLRAICVDAGLAAPGNDLSLTALLKKLREEHPSLSAQAAHEEHTGKVIRAMSAICDALNPIRNRGTLAHPNEELLGEADAMLAINASRTVLHYIHQKLES